MNKANVQNIFLLDDIEHSRDYSECDRFCKERRCPGCGWMLHYQPVYGGEIWQCANPECTDANQTLWPPKKITSASKVEP